MNETAIVAENVEVIQATGRSRAAFSWSAAIAGAFGATAITFILIALGSGIGLAVTSPYSGPSVGTMTIAGAVWLVFAQALGFAAGGYYAARVRVGPEVAGADASRFRDGATGFLVWAIGAVAAALIVVVLSVLSLLGAARVAGDAAQVGAAVTPTEQLGYYVDQLTRGNQPAPSGTNAEADRAQVTRILATSIRNGRLADDDRAYLAGLVAARTGLGQDEAQRRVDDVFNRARESLKQTADTVRRTAAYVSFWTFMSLLFGAVAATLGGILGGELRDEYDLGLARAPAE
jgi:hypothetical protein